MEVAMGNGTYNTGTAGTNSANANTYEDAGGDYNIWTKMEVGDTIDFNGRTLGTYIDESGATKQFYVEMKIESAVNLDYVNPKASGNTNQSVVFKSASPENEVTFSLTFKDAATGEIVNLSDGEMQLHEIDRLDFARIGPEFGDDLKLHNWVYPNPDATRDSQYDYDYSGGVLTLQGLIPTYDDNTSGGYDYVGSEWDTARSKLTFTVGTDAANMVFGWRMRSESGDVTVTCFASGTMIDTVNGPVMVEALSVGNAVRTQNHGDQIIRWIGSTKLTAEQLDRNPKLLPVRIKAGALGQGLPERDLLVSRQHRILVRSRIAQRMFGATEILVPAIKLVGYDGIAVAEDVKNVIYWHILFDQHESVFSEGAPTESLFTGPEALKSVPTAVRKELMTLFPELASPDFSGTTIRPMVNSSKEVRKLLARHIKHSEPLLGLGR